MIHRVDMLTNAETVVSHLKLYQNCTARCYVITSCHFYSTWRSYGLSLTFLYRKQGSLKLSVSVQLLDGAPAVAQVPYLSLYSVSPCSVESAPPEPCIWCAAECRRETESFSLLMTWPVHRHRLCMMIVPMHSCSHCIGRFLLEMVLFHSVIHRHSNPYKRVYRTQPW